MVNLIGGNIEASLVKITASGRNDVGGKIVERKEICKVRGWLDLEGGSANYANNAKLQETSHVFICDYNPQLVGIKKYNTQPAAEKGDNLRLVVDGCEYDVLLIDDPMMMHHHIEIYLKYIG